MLYKPGQEIEGHPAPETVLHVLPIRHQQLSAEFDRLFAFFASQDVKVVPIDPAPIGDDRLYRYNMMYCRDLLFMTPEGAVLAGMAEPVRRHEVPYAERALKENGIPVLAAVDGGGRFEGADALWMTDRLVAIGVGSRTNREGFEQVRDVLRRMGIECVALPFRRTRTQHLLGAVQIVDADLVLVRSEIVERDVLTFLRERNFTIVHVPENREVLERQAMNIVALSPRTVLMAAGCPMMKAVYADAGLAVAAEIDITELLKGAGGLACATGIIARS